MKRNVLHYLFNLEYAAAALLVLLFIFLLNLLSPRLPETDETSWLNPIFDRIDFLNIADISLDAIFATKDMEYCDRRIIVVNVGEVAPTPDMDIVTMLYKLHSYDVGVIGLDIFLDDAHYERFDPEVGPFVMEAMAAALSDIPNVVIVKGYDEETLKPQVEPDSLISTLARNQAYVNLQTDDDEVVRRFWPYRTIEGERWLSFAVKVLQLYDPSLAERILQLPEGDQVIYYTGAYKQISTYHLRDIVSVDEEIEPVLKKSFQGALVLVGFLNEAGWFYVNDTHRTPLGRKQGIEGPDMSGILIHANILNMLLTGKFVAPVPDWVDWLIAFVLSYLSIAFYRVLRIKAGTKLGVTFLIMTMIVLETIIVFFIPLIAFYKLDVKISYNLMAAAVLLFIPASALSTKVRIFLLGWSTRRQYAHSRSPVPDRLISAFADDEPFPAHMRLLFSAEYAVHYALAIETANRLAGGEQLSPDLRMSGELTWPTMIPALGSICASKAKADEQCQLYQFLAGNKEQLIRDSWLKDYFFSTELDSFNEFFKYQEWEVMLPMVLQMYRKTLADYLDYEFLSVLETGEGGIAVEPVPGMRNTPRYQQPEMPDSMPAGLYMRKSGSGEPVAVSPFCEWTECKLHRKNELFVFAGLLKKQFGMEELPVYFGNTISCEPALQAHTLVFLREIFAPDGTKDVTN